MAQPTAYLPGHVPPDLFVDFHFLSDPRLAIDIFKAIRNLSAETPELSYTPEAEVTGWLRIARWSLK